MKTVWIQLLIVLILIAPIQAVHAAQMSNNDVIQLLKAGIAESIVLQAVDSGEPNFDTSAAAIAQMKKEGASDALIQKIVLRQFSSRSTTKTVPSNTQPTSEQLSSATNSQEIGKCKYDPTDVGIMIVDGDTAIKRSSKTPERLKSADMGSAVASRLTFGLVGAQASSSIGLSGDKSDLGLSGKLPTFKNLYIPEDGNAKKSITLVRFEIRDGKRVFDLARAERGLLKTESITNLNSFIALKFVSTGARCMFGANKGREFQVVAIEVQPEQILTSGEYGLLIGKSVVDFRID